MKLLASVTSPYIYQIVCLHHPDAQKKRTYLIDAIEKHSYKFFHICLKPNRKTACAFHINYYLSHLNSFYLHPHCEQRCRLCGNGLTLVIFRYRQNK